MSAVIKTGGKQYLVKPGETVMVEKLKNQVGEQVIFDQVLLITEPTVKIGNPIIKGAKVTGQVIKQGRSPKVTGVKFHNKVRYHRKFGHRQAFTEVKITDIS